MTDTEELLRELVALRAENARLKELAGKTARAEEALAHSEERFKSQFQHLPIPTYIFKWNGSDLALLEFNAAGDAITQGSVRNFVGTPARKMHAGRPQIIEDLHRCFTERTTIKRQMTYQLQMTGQVKELVATYVFVPPDMVAVHTEDETERKLADAALRESEERYRTLFESSPVGLGVADETGMLLAYNDAMLTPGGYTREDIRRIGNVAALYADPAERDATMALARKQGFLRQHEVRFRRKDGSIYYARMSLQPITLNGKRGWQAMSEDITHSKQLEAQLLQAQKMESVGRLAGGVAHDFNNLLTGILGHTELLAMRLPPEFKDDVEGIRQISLRAAHLTRQLLGFARKQRIEARVLDLNEVLTGIGSLLMRLIGERITLRTVSGPGLHRVKADRGQFEQIVINLALNACDAMPHGGTLTIRTENVRLDNGAALERSVAAGDYVTVSVADSGVGMSDEIKAHIFEPFFTTKEVGKGTGLGLATCYGIVKQHGGDIWVESAPGFGTTFHFILPASNAPAEAPRAEAAALLPGGHETVLLVEDEPTVRSISVSALRSAGYRVREAGDGIEALRSVSESPQGVDLLVTDVVMPRMGGRELAQQLSERWRNLRVLYISGYMKGEIAEGKRVAFLQKPFTPEQLVRKAREVLDGKG
jgi:PAS domain S-box-containing protein